MNERHIPHKVIVHGTVSVPKSILTNDDVKRITSDLIYHPKHKDPIAGYQEDHDYYHLPKFWYMENFGKKFRHLVENREPEGPYEPWEFNGTLRPHQASPPAPFTATTELPRLLHKHRGVFASAACGSGKTVSAIYTASRIGGKTIIVVPSEAVFDQWVAQMKHFCPSVSLGFLGGGKKKLTGRVIVAMLQTLYKWHKDKIDCDLLIVDEAHMIAAEQFQKCVFNVNFKYSLPLTATGKRYDELDPLFRRALSRTEVQLDTDQMPVDVHLYPYQHEINKQRKFNAIGERQQFGIDLALSEDDDRNIFLIDLIARAVKKGRRLLVLGKYKDHLKLLAQCVHELTNVPYVLFMGSTTAKKKRQIKKLLANPNTVMYATLKKGGVGLDISHFDSLIYTLPVADPRQLIGRIQRAEDGKKRPIVIDVVDNLHRLRARAASRVKKGYLTIETARVINRCSFLNPGVKHPRLEKLSK